MNTDRHELWERRRTTELSSLSSRIFLSSFGPMRSFLIFFSRFSIRCWWLFVREDAAVNLIEYFEEGGQGDGHGFAKFSRPLGWVHLGRRVLSRTPYFPHHACQSSCQTTKSRAWTSPHISWQPTTYSLAKAGAGQGGNTTTCETIAESQPGPWPTNGVWCTWM